MLQGENFEFMAASVAALDATADVLTFRASFPCRVVRFGALVSVACTGDAVIALDRTTHVAAGTPTRADAVGGKTLDSDAQEVGTVIYAEPDEEVIVKPGDILHLQVTNAFTAGDGFPFIQYQQLNWDKTGPNSKFADATPTTRLVDGSTDV